LTNATHWPWFLNFGFVNVRQPPCLHWLFAVGVVDGGAAAASKSYVVLLPLTPIVSLSALPSMLVHAAPPQPAARMTPPPPTLTIRASGCVAAGQSQTTGPGEQGAPPARVRLCYRTMKLLNPAR
jgi:hypothetical protein